MSIGIGWNTLFVVVVGAFLWWLLDLYHRRRPSPYFPVSALALFQKSRIGVRQRLAFWPRKCFFVALGLFFIALIDPRIQTEKNADDSTPTSKIPPVVEGVAVYFILDQSGSMAEKAQVTTNSGRVQTTKMELLKQLTKAFIEGDPKAGLNGRPSDMIGLVAFARTAQILSPLTLDHKMLIDQLNQLDIMRIKDQDGTGIGYAIYKTANLIAATRHFAENLRGQGKPAYEIKDAVMILVTDGMQDPNPLDQHNKYRWMDPEQAAAFAKKENIHLYIVNIDPEYSKPEWAANRKQMERMATMTGGRFYSLGSASNINQIYQEIDSLSKSAIPASSAVVEHESEDYDTLRLYPYLIALGMTLFAAALILQTTWLRIAP